MADAGLLRDAVRAAAPAGPPVSDGQVPLLRDRLAAEELAVELMQAEPAPDGELALAHTPAYIQGISDGSVDPKILREIGFPWSPAMAERARRSVGATMAACRAAFAEGVAANIAGGTHHAMADRAVASACSTTPPWPRG
jgi:acetoin utilization deacetylase AcuC-like enzyme